MVELLAMVGKLKRATEIMAPAVAYRLYGLDGLNPRSWSGRSCSPEGVHGLACLVAEVEESTLGAAVAGHVSTPHAHDPRPGQSS